MADRHAKLGDPAAPLLAVDGLTTALATEEGEVDLIRDVSLDLSPGRTLGLVGESGSGKSMTMSSIVRLLPANARIAGGSVRFRGIELTTADDAALQAVRGAGIAMVFQDSMTSLNPLLTIGRQIVESIETHLGQRGEPARRRARELLEEVGVPAAQRRLDQFPHQLSGGLRQRAALAVALAADPAVLIADEPTTALDTTVQAQLLELLIAEQRRRGMALVLITHDLGVVARMSDELAVMYAGRIVERGPSAEVFARPRHPYTLALLESVPRLDSPILDRLPSIPGTPPAPGEIAGGCPFRERCAHAFDRCADEAPVLESVGDAASVACWRPAEPVHAGASA